MVEIRHAHSSHRPPWSIHSLYGREVGGKAIRKDMMLPGAFTGYDLLKCAAECSLIAVGTGSHQR